MEKEKQIEILLSDLDSAGITGYDKIQTTLLTVIKTIFGEEHEFCKKAYDIKKGWIVEGAIEGINGKYPKAEYEKNKFRAYTDLLNEAKAYLGKYNADEKEIDAMSTKKVFIVHGHDTKLKFEMHDWLQHIELDPVILHLQANCGTTTIIEKIEANSEVCCAIVLLTADDLGASKKESNLLLRARQNVVFEAGYFIGKLGRKRVIMLYDKDIEAPGDLSGCIYISTGGCEEWKDAILREFDALKIVYNSNRVKDYKSKNDNTQLMTRAFTSKNEELIYSYISQKENGASLNEIANNIAINISTAKKLLERLIKNGFIVTASSSRDTERSKRTVEVYSVKK